jgi:hypothetical protein
VSLDAGYGVNNYFCHWFLLYLILANA